MPSLDRKTLKGQVGDGLANAPEVSHCYARNPVPNFPYTLYSMVHGSSRESFREITRELSRETGLGDYAVLSSEREFKKQRLRVFPAGVGSLVARADVTSALGSLDPARSESDFDRSWAAENLCDSGDLKIVKINRSKYRLMLE